MTTFNINSAGESNNERLTGKLVYTAPALPRPPLFGVDCASIDLAEVNALYPLNAYHRIFPGTSGLLPDLTNKSSKLFRLPAHTVRHVSWDQWEPAVFRAWLGAVVQLAPPWELWLSLNHEVNRPEKKIDPATYRTQLTEMARVCDDYSPLVNRLSVIVTGYFLDELAGNPNRYLIDGFELDVDRYNLRNTLYRTPEELFDPLIEAVQGTGRSSLAIPEFGGELIDTDTSVTSTNFGGEGRANWLRDCYRYVSQAPVDAVGWWNIGGCELLDAPSRETMRTIVAMQ